MIQPNRRLLASAVFVLILSTLAHAQANDVESRVDSYVQAQMTRQKIPGVAVAVIKDGQPIIAKGYGLANIELNVPVKPETIFQSGSMGKQFTSTAVMLLGEEGKIDL